MRRPAGMGGGRVLRAVGRAVGTGADAVSAVRGAWTTKPARSVSVSSVTTSPPAPSSAASSSSFTVTSPTGDQSQSSQASNGWFHNEWDVVWDNYGWEKEERLVFGPPPTKEEAEEAVATIQQIIVPSNYSQVTEDDQLASSSNVVIDDMNSSNGDMVESQYTGLTGSNWIEPSRSMLSSRALQSSDYGNVFDALQLLQINPAIQRMVISLSSDKAVWDAVMKNDVVQEIKKSFSEEVRYANFCSAGSVNSENSGETEDDSTGLLSWIMENIAARLSEIIENIGKVVRELFHLQPKQAEKSGPFDAAIRTSFLLSVIAFVVVVVARLRRI